MHSNNATETEALGGGCARIIRCIILPTPRSDLPARHHTGSPNRLGNVITRDRRRSDQPGHAASELVTASPTVRRACTVHHVGCNIIYFVCAAILARNEFHGLLGHDDDAPGAEKGHPPVLTGVYLREGGSCMGFCRSDRLPELTTATFSGARGRELPRSPARTPRWRTTAGSMPCLRYAARTIERVPCFPATSVLYVCFVL